MKLPFLPAVAALVLVGVSSIPAGATVITFSDRSAFLAATAATDATGAYPGSSGALLGPTTVGSVTFSAASGGQAFFFGDWTARLAGSEISINAREDLNVDLGGPVTALGFDFVEPESDPNVFAPFVDSTFTVSLFNGAAFVNSFSFNAPNDTAAFAGVWSSAVFTRAVITETTGGIENEFYGHFYTGTRPLAQSVPDSGAGAVLVLGGLAVLAGLRRRR